MTPCAFDLHFQSNSEDPSAVLEATAHVYLCSSTPASCQDREDRILLSRQCLTVHELRREIDRLQKDLEHLWHVGRRKFSEFEKFKKSQLERAAASLEL